MKNLITALVGVVLLMGARAHGGGAMDTSFSYQARLSEAGVPANGTYTIYFRLWDAQAASEFDFRI